MATAYGLPQLSTNPINAEAARKARTERYSKSNVGFIKRQGNQYYNGFKFDTNVLQIWYNEYTRGLPNPPMKKEQPWRAIEKANNAFIAEAQAIIEANYPKFVDIITVETLTINGGK